MKRLAVDGTPIRTSDVSGMDWSLGGSALLAAHSAVLNTRNPSLSTAGSWLHWRMPNATRYTWSTEPYTGNLATGFSQTGSSWKTWIDNIPRKLGLNARYGIRMSGRHLLPIPDYKPFLVERDVRVTGPKGVGWCGRTWDENGAYVLDKFGGILSKIAGHLFDAIQVDEVFATLDGVEKLTVEQYNTLEKCFGAISSARHEGRFDKAGTANLEKLLGFVAVMMTIL